MFITVVIPTYNMAHSLIALVDKLYYNQNGTYEIIVVDNGSTDNTEKLCQAYVKVGAITYIKATDKASSYYARNVGVKHAKGTHILFLDADVNFKGNLVAEYQRLNVKNAAVIGSVNWTSESRAVVEVMTGIELRTANVLIPKMWLIDTPFRDTVTSGEDVRYLSSVNHVFFTTAAVEHKISLKGMLDRAYRYGTGRAADFDPMDYITFCMFGWLSTGITMLSHYLAIDPAAANKSFINYRYLWWYKTGQLVKSINPKIVVR